MRRFSVDRNRSSSVLTRTESLRRRLEEQRARIEYQALPTRSPGELDEDFNEVERTQAQVCLESDAFNNTMAVIILANGAVIGMETDIKSFEYWEVIEAIFLFIFVGELSFKIAVKRLMFFHIDDPDFLWNWFDMIIVGLGLFDFLSDFIGASSTGGIATIFRMVRLLRVLRILRLLKVLKPLFMLAYGLIEACKAIVWVTLLMSFVLYILSIVLVKTVGEPGETDPHYEFLVTHFCTIPTSMITLFVLMSSPNLPTYQDEEGLLGSRPMFCLFLVMFICFGSFGMLAMLTGVINESMFENNDLRKEERKLEHECMRLSLGRRSALLYETLPVDQRGRARVRDLAEIAGDAAKMLDEAGVDIAQGDVLKFLELMDDDEAGVITMPEFVKAIERIAEGVSPLAMVEVQHNVALCKKKLSTQMQNMVDIEEKIEEQVERTAEEVERILTVISSDHSDHRMEVKEKIDSQIQRTAEEVDRILEAVTGNHHQHRTEVVDKIESQMLHTGAEVDRILRAVSCDQHEHRTHLVEKIEAQMLHTAEQVDSILHALTSKQHEHWTQLAEHIEIHMQRTSETLHKILQTVSGARIEHRAPSPEKTEPFVHRAEFLACDESTVSRLPAGGDELSDVASRISKSEAILLAAVSKQTDDIQIALDRKLSALESQLALKVSNMNSMQVEASSQLQETSDVQIALERKFSGLENQLALKVGNLSSLQVNLTSQLQEISGSLHKLLQASGSQAKLDEMLPFVRDVSKREQFMDSMMSDLARLLQDSENSLAHASKREQLIDSLMSDITRLMQKSENSAVMVARAQESVSENLDLLSSKVSLLKKEADSMQTGVLTSVAELGGDIMSKISELISASLATMKQELVFQKFHALTSSMPSREDTLSTIPDTPGAANR